MYDKRVVRGSNYSHMHMQPVSKQYLNFNKYPSPSAIFKHQTCYPITY